MSAISSDILAIERAEMPFPPAIDISHVTKVFTLTGVIPGRALARVTALDDLTLHVDPASIHAVIGPNGSGKSTLLKILATLILPTSGKAWIEGVDVVQEPLRIRRSIGFTSGDRRGLYWRLTGRQNLAFYAALYHLPSPAPRIQALLELLDLGEAAERPVSSYSDGMSRRVGLARALLNRPRVLLLDEPTRSLDLASRDTVHRLLQRLRQREETTTLMTTHDPAEVADLCDAVTVLDRGSIVHSQAPVDHRGLERILRGHA